MAQNVIRKTNLPYKKGIQSSRNKVSKGGNTKVVEVNHDQD